MTRTKIVFSYSEICDFSQPTEITMEMPERSIDEMCEYFQRFLTACGYIFDEGEYIRPVKQEKDSYYPGCGGDILTFNQDGTPFCYDFGESAEDVISFGKK